MNLSKLTTEELKQAIEKKKQALEGAKASKNEQLIANIEKKLRTFQD